MPFRSAVLREFPDLAWMRCRADLRQVHRHTVWECIRTLDSRTQITCMDRMVPLCQGDIVIVPPGLPHAVHGPAGGRIPYIEILSASGRLVDGLRLAGIGIDRLERIASFGLRLSCSKGCWPARQPRNKTETLVALIYCMASAAASSAAEPLVVYDGPLPSLLAAQHHARIIAYIDEQHQNPVGLRQCASSLGLSQATICRTLRYHAGTTFAKVLVDRRMATVEGLLGSSDDPVGMLAYAAGFGSLASFNRRFRLRHGESPSAWRARNR